MDEEEIIRHMSRRETHENDEPVEVVETHGARVFLTDDLAYKIKRPVKYHYLDFSTPDKRKVMLERELALNRRGAPGLYRSVIPITRESSGELALNGSGDPVEWCLVMRRFPKSSELSTIASSGGLTCEIAQNLGHTIANYHAGLKPRDADGPTQIGAVVDQLRNTLPDMADMHDRDAVMQLLDNISYQAERHDDLLAARGAEGFIRRGHGDLHLGNLVMLEGRPVPFDALEFDEGLATLDVLYDLAFLLMDLWHRGLKDAANVTFNAWLAAMDDERHLDGLALLPLFLALRAGIRAMVAMQAARLSDGLAGSGKVAEARDYLASALGFVAARSPEIVAVGGVSGTGKTTLARGLSPAIGPAPGAVHLRSDVERKALFGVDPLTRLPADAYDRETGNKVYERLTRKADRTLAAGHGVMVDAVHLRLEERRETARIAMRHGIPFTGLWLDADRATLVARVGARRGDASDADAGVVEKQLSAYPSVTDWTTVDAGGTAEETLANARAALGLT